MQCTAVRYDTLIKARSLAGESWYKTKPDVALMMMTTRKTNTRTVWMSCLYGMVYAESGLVLHRYLFAFLVMSMVFNWSS